MAAMMARQRIEVTASPRAEVSAAGSPMSAGSAPTPSAQTPYSLVLAGDSAFGEACLVRVREDFG